MGLCMFCSLHFRPNTSQTPSNSAEIDLDSHNVRYNFYFNSFKNVNSLEMLYLSAALTGTVLFSTIILWLVATLEMCRAAVSMYFKSGALPFSSKEIIAYLLHRMGLVNSIKFQLKTL